MENSVVEAFKFGTLQDCMSVKRKLDENGISWEEFEEWVEEKKAEGVDRSRVGPRLVMERHCPKCSEGLTLKPVNHGPGFMLDDDSLNSVWQCPSCGWEEYSKLKTEEEVKPFMIKIL